MVLGLAAGSTGGAVTGLQPPINVTITMRTKVASERRCIFALLSFIRASVQATGLTVVWPVITGGKAIVATMKRENISQRA